jgi:hypothetical protein
MTLTHGTYYCYQRGKCRCEPCRAAARAVNKHHKDLARAKNGLPPLRERSIPMPGRVPIFMPFAEWSAARLASLRRGVGM